MITVTFEYDLAEELKKLNDWEKNLPKTKQSVWCERCQCEHQLYTQADYERDMKDITDAIDEDLNKRIMLP